MSSPTLWLCIPYLVTIEYFLLSLCLVFGNLLGQVSTCFKLCFVDHDGDEHGPLQFLSCEWLSVSFAQFSIELFLLNFCESFKFSPFVCCNCSLPVCCLPLIFMASFVLQRFYISLQVNMSVFPLLSLFIYFFQQVGPFYSKEFCVFLQVFASLSCQFLSTLFWKNCETEDGSPFHLSSVSLTFSSSLLPLLFFFQEEFLSRAFQLTVFSSVVMTIVIFCSSFELAFFIFRTGYFMHERLPSALRALSIR